MKLSEIKAPKKDEVVRDSQGRPLRGLAKERALQQRKLDKNFKDYDIKDHRIGVAKVVKEAAIKELDKIAAERFGSFGFADLEEDQAARLIYIERANKIAEKEFGEFGLMSCNATEIAQIINANPALIKKVNEEELESKTAEDLWSENSSSASKYISTATYQVRPIKDSKPVKYEAFSVISTTRKPYGTFTADELNAALKPIRPNQTPDAEGFTTYIDPVKVDAFQYSGDPVKVDLGKGDIQTADDSDYIVRTVDGNNFVYRIEEAGDFEAGLKKA